MPAFHYSKTQETFPFLISQKWKTNSLAKTSSVKLFPGLYEPLPGLEGEIPFKQFYTLLVKYFHVLDH